MHVSEPGPAALVDATPSPTVEAASPTLDAAPLTLEPMSCR